ncbi:unnamed protein product, partial [marine sediment metagenome]
FDIESPYHHLLVYDRFWYPTKFLLNKVERQTSYNLPIHLYHCIIFDIIDKKNQKLPLAEKAK